ncbi:MAG: ATP-binding protein [Thermoplasmatota archaeon]
MTQVQVAAAPHTRQSARILIVEDDPLFRRFSTTALHGSPRLAVQADAAGSLAEAAQMLKEAAYDCVLLDLGLPDGHGTATVRAILAAAPSVPVVVMTGEEDGEIAAAALREGAQDFIEKTQTDPGQLERAIRHAVERGRWAAELAAKAAELAARNAELDDFAHVVSHDLKAPLRAIHYLVLDAQGHLEAGRGEAASEELQGIAPRVQRLFGMIDGVLQLTQAGRVRGTPAPLDTRALVDEVVASLGVPAGFQVRVGPLPAMVADRVALARVFQNLIDNALKHHGGPSGSVDVGGREAGPLCEFTVADDGPGIPPNLREAAFRLFQTLGPQGKGSGVGLALVRKVVEAHGGAIRIEDGEGGRGVRFCFTWPREPRS